MGTWGPGVFQNDHACDLGSLEVAALIQKIDEVLAIPDAAFDDIEGPLVYVHLLAHLAAGFDVSGVDRLVAQRWKKRYLDIFDATITGAKEAYLAKRREVIAAEFDALIQRLPEASTAPKPAPKKRAVAASPALARRPKKPAR